MSLIKKLFKIALFLTFVGINGQVQKTFTPRYTETINGDVTMIANNVLSRTKTGNFNGSSDNQENFSVFVDIDSDNTTFNSSSANLVKPIAVPNSCIGIRKVLLYWAASDKEYDPSDNTGDGGTVEPNSRFDQVKLMLPGETNYNMVTADEIIYRGRDDHFFNDPYICMKDITSDVSGLTDPYGTYQIANLKATEGDLIPHGGGNFGAAGGWQIVFVYEFQSLTRKNITLFDGYAHVRNNASVDVLFDGFTTVPSGPVNADIVLGSIEGDRVLNGDTFQILKSDNTFESINTSQRDANNFFNSKITLNGSDFLDRNPASTNTLGYDASIFPLSNNSNRLIDNNQTSATFRATSGSESYGLYLMGFSVEVFEPSLGNLDFTTTSSDTSFNPGGDVQLSLGVENSGNDNIRNLVISTIIPVEVDFLNTEPLPSGVTSSYNSSTRELVFNIADGLTDVGNALFTLDFNVTIKEQCYFLETACAGNFEIQAIAQYNGEINTTQQTTNSSGTTDACSNGNHDPTFIGINRPDQVNFDTAINALDRTVSCSDTAALNAAQALVPTTEFCDFTLNKVSGSFLPNADCDVEGTYTNTWTFTDACGRVSETFTQVITIEDTTAPIFNGTLPANIPAASNNIPTPDILTAIDNCDSNPAVVLNETFVGDNTSDTYTIIRTWTASDCAGNETIHVQRVFVTENGDPLGIAINDVSVNENDGTAIFTVSLTGEFGAFSVDYATTNATAEAPGDFNAISTSSLSFNGNHGETQNINVSILDDSFVEATETYTVNLNNLTPNVTVINEATGTGTINDNDNASVRIEDITVNEAIGSFNLNVILEGNAQEAFTIDFTTVNGTATAGSDYIARAGQISFPANSSDGSIQNISLDINDDNLIEIAEDYFVNLSNLTADGAISISDNQGMVTITDSDAVAGTGLDFDSTEVTVNEAVGTATFTVRLTGNVPGGFTVDFATANGTAIAGNDYTANAGTLSFAGNNDETQDITVSITDDALIETTEGYVVDLSNLSTTLIGINTPRANGSIIDNDAVTGTGLNFDSTEVTVNEAAGTATFTVRLTGNVPGGFTVDFATANGTAIAGNDYTANAGTLTFTGNNDETQDITVSIADDTLIETTEGYLVDLSNISTTLIGINTPRANGNITDNDAVAGTGLDFDSTNVTVDEAAGTATFTVRLTGNVPGGFTVDFATANGTAISGNDYIANAGTLSFAGNNDETQEIVIAITDDTLIETTEGYVVDLSNLSTTLIGINTPRANGNITDNDAVAGTGLDFDSTEVSVNEVAGTATFTVRLTGNVPGGFTVDFATANGTAIAGNDYTVNAGTLTFAGNNNETQDIVIAITDDNLIEFTEGYVVDLSNLSTTLIGINTPRANGNITDNDAVAGTGLDFDSTEVTVDEAAGTATFTVRLTGNVPGGFTVDFATANGTAIAGNDYTANAGTLAFTGNNNETQDITVSITDDALIETTEGYVVDLSNLSTTLIGINTPRANGNITDNDAVAGTGLDFDSTEVTVDEAAGTATFTVRLTGNVPGGFTVDFATANGTAIAGNDYTANAGTLAFTGNNDETQDIVIAITDDNLIETTEGYVVNLSGLSTTLIGINTPRANGNITDNDAVAGTGLDFDSTEVTVNEAAGTATFTVRLTGNVPGGFTVDFATANGTAIAGNDYTANAGTLAFAGNNDETQDIVIAITDDNLIETTEGYVVNLSGLSTALIGINTPQANGNITDNDAVAGTGLDFDSTEVTVNEAAGTATFTVRLTGNVPGGFTVDFATANGTAIAGNDYTANAGTLSFTGNNDETRDIVIAITDDNLIETTEGYVVNLSGLSTALIGINTPQANGNITDNDAVAGTGLDFDSTEVTVNEAAGTATFTVRLTGNVPGGFTVDFATANGTAIAGNDYTANAGTLSFAGNNDETRDIVIAITDDNLIETTEGYVVNLSGLSTALIGINTPRANGNITDNDAVAGTGLDFDSTEVSVDEAAGTATFTVRLTGNVPGGFTVDFATANGTAIAGNDYTANAGTLSFTGNNDETRDIVIAITDDNLIETTEGYVVNLSGLSTTLIGINTPRANGNITDNDAVAGTGLDFDSTEVTVNEAAGTATFTVRLTGNVPGGFTVDFATANGTAIAGNDYTANAGTLSFAGNNDETQDIVIAITDDNLIETTEGYVVDLSNLSTTLIGINTPRANGNITDNDAVAGTGLDFDSTEVTVDEAAGTATFTVRLTGNVPGGFTVDFATANGTAIAGNDYTANAGTLAFTGNNNETQDIVIAITDDALIETTEGYVVDLSNLSTTLIGINTPRANGNITDNDAVAGTGLDFDSTEVSVDEAAGTATFTVRLTGNVPGGFTVDFATANGTAIAGNDYTANAGTLSFAGNNDETQDIVIAITDDNLIETTEGYVVNLSGLSTTLIGINTPRANGNITDNDAVAGTGLDFDSTEVSVDEAAGTATFTVRLTGNVPGGFTVDFATANGTAIAGNDYTANAGTLAFTGNNNETQDITVSITDDALIETTEGYVVDLSNLSTTLIGINTPRTNGNITDNDAVAGTGLDFDSTEVSVDEAAGTATFTVRLTGNVPGGFTVDFATANGTAIAGNDYTANAGTLTFTGNNDETQDIVIAITDDALIETTEGYVVDLSNLSTTLIGINTPRANGNITDNDSTDGYPMDITVNSCDDIPTTDIIIVDRLCDVTLTHQDDIISGDADACPSEYTITRTWTVTNCNGFTTEHIQTITVLDRDNPEFVGTLPADTTASCDTVPLAEIVTATDNCSGIATVDFNEEIVNQDASCPNNYQIIRTWTATDCAGNTAVHTQTIIVEDKQAPTFVESLPQNMTVSCNIIPDAEVLTAQDNCDPNVAVTFTETITNDANCAQGYTITRIWTAIDCSGNDVDHTQVLTIDPTGPITVNDYEEEVTITCGNTIPEVPELVFMGGCGDYQVVFNEVEEFSDASDDYMIIRSWDVTDACGNTAHFEQIVFVLQPKLEEISITLCVEDEAVDLASYLPASFDSNGTFSIDGSNIEVVNGNFDPSLFELGTYTVLYSSTQATCNYLAEFTIEVNADCVPCGVDQLEFSKTITANGDGKNDVFEIKGAEFCDYIFEVQIFNRWGNIVYQSNDYQNDWNAVAPNGSFGSSGTVPSGTYYYIVNIKNSDIKTINGFLYIGAN